MSLNSRKNNLLASSDFSFIEGLYKTMDKYCIDPILGLILPGLGDIITSLCTIPFIAVALFRIRSIPLTLAVVLNMLTDSLLGVVPGIGDIFDFLHKSYKKSYCQIVGYASNDQAIVEEVHSKALIACILITVLCVAIRLLVLLFSSLFASVFAWFGNLF